MLPPSHGPQGVTNQRTRYIPGQVKVKQNFRDRFNPKRRKMGRVSRTTELKLLALLSSFDPSAFDSALLGFDFTQGAAATAIELSRPSTTDRRGS